MIRRESFWSTQSTLLTKRGQSTIEVLVCLSIVLSLILMISKFGLNITSGFMVHYANYMASRAYLVFDTPSSSIGAIDAAAKTAAEEAFKSYGISAFFMGGAKIIGDKVNVISPDEADRKVLVGTYVKIEQPFSGSKMFGGLVPVTMYSESYLGREPTRLDCAEQICTMMKATASGVSCGRGTSSYGNINITEFDDGC